MANKDVLRGQIIAGVLVAGIFGGGGYAMYSLWATMSAKPEEQQAPKKIELKGMARSANADQAWWKRSDDRMSDMEKQLADLRGHVTKPSGEAPPVGSEVAELQRRMVDLEGNFKAVVDQHVAALQKSEAEKERLQQQLAAAQLGQVGAGRYATGSAGYGDLPPGGNVFGNPSQRRAAADALGRGRSQNGGQGGDSGRPGPKVVTIKLTSREAPGQAAESHDPALYVAAGAYAPVRVISGADVTAGVTEQSDPKPMLARVLGAARSVIDKGTMRKTDLAGCLVTLEGRADLPSERVYSRPVRMSCPAPGGRVRELVVKGYLADRGTAGIRGVVTERTGDLVGKAALAGAVAGLGSTVNNALSPGGLNGLSITTGDDGRSTGRKLKDAGLAGLGGGAQSGGDRLADYYIDRLEQIQPVISAPSGAELELVFLEGFYLDGRPSGEEQQTALDGQLERAATTINGIPPAMQAAIAAQAKGAMK